MQKRGAVPIISIILNFAVAVMAVIGAVMNAQRSGLGLFMFYTVDSNLLAAVGCAACAAFQLRALATGKAAPKWAAALKYISVCCLSVTFLTVLLVLAPMNGARGYVMMFFSRDMLFHHFLCPILALVSFFLTDTVPLKPAKAAALALLPTLLYAAVTVTLNLTRTIEGPYPFLRVYEQSVWMSLLWAVLIVGGAYGVAFLLAKLNRRRA